MLQFDIVLGAICGATFFMLMPAIFDLWFKQALLGIISLIGGYLAGIAAGEHGGWVAFVTSALLITALFAVVKLLNNNKVLEFMRLALDAIRTLKK